MSADGREKPFDEWKDTLFGWQEQTDILRDRAVSSSPTSWVGGRRRKSCSRNKLNTASAINKTVMSENIEKKVAKEILQQPEEIKVGDKVYKAAPPSAATLILVSEAVSRMPKIKLDTEKIVDEALSVGKDCRPVGEIIAIMILGAKGLTETRKSIKTVEKRRFWGIIKEREQVEVEEHIDHKAALAKSLLEDLTPRELHNLAARLLQRSQVADFFGLTTFLIEINLLRQTREVETTASGQ